MIDERSKSELAVPIKGLVLCNIGDGKGKTTAAIGSAVRASGAGLNVFILQFVKAKKKDNPKVEEGEWPLSNEINFFNEVKIPPAMGRIDCEQVGEGFVGILGDKKKKQTHIKEAVRGLELARTAMASGDYQLVILDEILSAVDLELLAEQDIIDLINTKPESLHLMLTGHQNYPRITDRCDTVTEMEALRHAYYDGVLAQKGIDF